MSAITYIGIPDEAAVFDIAREAAARELFVISKGPRFVLSTIVPEGWTRFIDKNMEPPCAA